MKERFHNILSWFAFGCLLIGAFLWASVLTNQYLNPEPKLLGTLTCWEDEGKERLEELAALRREQREELWIRFAEGQGLTLSDSDDWSAVIPETPCSEEDPFGPFKLMNFKGTLFFISGRSSARSWDEEYARQIPDYNPLDWRDERDREELGILLFIIWGVSITLNYLLFGVFRFLPWKRGDSAEG